MKLRSNLTRLLVILLVTSDFAACSQSTSSASAPAAVENPLATLDKTPMSETISAREDFYQHVNGPWLDATSIPDDQSEWGTRPELQARTRTQLEALIERLGSHPSDRNAQKIVALYLSFMDEARIEAAGLGPIMPDWNRIDALTDTQQIPALIAHLNQIGVGVPYELLIHQDARDSTHYVVDFRPGGLGLPCRDYYVSEDPRMAGVLGRYEAHVERMMLLAGGAGGSAKAIVGIETELARHQWTFVEDRDPIKTYNPYSVADLQILTGSYDWRSYLAAAGIGDKVKRLIVSQPSYFTAFSLLVESTPLAAWKAYFKWRVLAAAAPYLSKPYVEEQFAFYGTLLRGTPQNEPRAQRAVEVVNQALGEALGELYVKQYLKPKTKDQIDAMVQVVLAAFRTRIKSRDWMSPDTQKAAQKKLNTLVVKISNPIQYRNYDKLKIQEDDLFGNLTRAAMFEFDRNIAKLGKPIDRDEWKAPPQSLTAYYDPQLNDVAFPAALLQAPFYDIDAEQAANYAGIGVVIARAIARAFDDVGSHYAADGRLKDWLTGQDHDRLTAHLQALTTQYDTYEALPGLPVSGALTLGENLAEGAGLAIAYQAYHLALAGKEDSLVEGLTGNQRYFVTFSRVSRAKTRAEATEVGLLTDPHAPALVRIDAVLMNQPAFGATFGLEREDKMYRAPGEQVNLW